MPAYEKIWILSNEFGFDTFNKYFHATDHIVKPYIRENFDVFGYFNNSLSWDKSILSRLRNLLITAMEEQKTLPKMIVVVPEFDIIKLCIQRNALEDCRKVIDWMMREYDRLIMSQKEFVHLRCKKPNYPNFIWIEALLHDNFTKEDNVARALFNKAVNNAAMFHENTWSLQLKKLWDPQNNSLFTKEEYRYTADSLTTYWEAVDKTIKYADTILLKKSSQT